MAHAAISRCLRFYAGIIIRYVMTPALPGTDRHYSPRSKAEWEGKCKFMDKSGHISSNSVAFVTVLPPAPLL